MPLELRTGRERPRTLPEALTRCISSRRLSSTFGWTPKNEIGNGRWVMFGLLVGMMTEYATGASQPGPLARGKKGRRGPVDAST